MDLRERLVRADGDAGGYDPAVLIPAHPGVSSDFRSRSKFAVTVLCFSPHFAPPFKRLGLIVPVRCNFNHHLRSAQRVQLAGLALFSCRQETLATGSVRALEGQVRPPEMGGRGAVPCMKPPAASGRRFCERSELSNKILHDISDS